MIVQNEVRSNQFRPAIEVCEFSDRIIPSNDNDKFYPNAAKLVLRDISWCCIKEECIDIDTLYKLIQSDKKDIVDILSKDDQTIIGFRILNRDDKAADNILNVLRFYVSKSDVFNKNKVTIREEK